MEYLFQYQIKEVKIPLKTGELIVFYPQVKREERMSTGRFWWKKITDTVIWRSLRKDKDGYIFGSDVDYPVIAESSMEEAQAWIDKYEEQIRKYAEEDWTKKAVNWKDERFVKIHPVEKMTT